MQRLYKLLTAVLALTGCASLIMTGETNPLMAISGLALFPGYYRFLRGAPAAGKWVIGVLSIMALGVFFFDAAVVSGDVVVAVAHLTIAFQAIKSFDLKEPLDNLQVFFVALLQLIIASELTDSIAFGAIFVLFMVLLIAAMVLAHFMKEGFSDLSIIKRPLLVILLLALVGTSCIFIALPRVSARMFGRSHVRGMVTSGFSNDMDFGSFGKVILDPAVVMRVEMDRDAQSGPLYWRGTTFDYFDGVVWRNSLSGLRRRIYRSQSGENQYVFPPDERGRAVQQTVYLEPMDSDVIFGLSEVKAIKTDSFRVVTDGAHSVYLPGKRSRSIQYTVYSIPADSYPGVADPRYLQLPAGVENIGALARRVAAGAVTAAGKVIAVEGYLLKNYTYSLSTAQPEKGVSAIEDFLFHSKKGYCEHYATSMVLMLRFLGIPARIVVGFHGGERNKYGGYVIVRESDAHSWVEALIDGRWTRFDPTPAAGTMRPSSLSLFLDSLKMNWARYVVAFSSRDQMGILKAFSFPFALPGLYGPRLKRIPLVAAVYVLFFLFFLGCAIWYVARLVHFRRYGFVSGGYMKFRNLLEKKGVTVSPLTTAGDLRKAAREGNWKSAEEFLTCYEEARFGNKKMGSKRKKRYEELLREVRKECAAKRPSIRVLR
jgi:transglutaminase-like putative cysteine protease